MLNTVAGSSSSNMFVSELVRLGMSSGAPKLKGSMLGLEGPYLDSRVFTGNGMSLAFPRKPPRPVRQSHASTATSAALWRLPCDAISCLSTLLCMGLAYPKKSKIFFQHYSPSSGLSYHYTH